MASFSKGITENLTVSDSLSPFKGSPNLGVVPKQVKGLLLNQSPDQSGVQLAWLVLAENTERYEVFRIGSIVTSNTNQLALPISDGDTLTISINGNIAQTITFSNTIITDGAATSQEIVDNINAQLVGATAFRSTNDITNLFIRVPANKLASVKVTGGTANAVLNFPTDLCSNNLSTSKSQLVGTTKNPASFFEDFDGDKKDHYFVQAVSNTGLIGQASITKSLKEFFDDVPGRTIIFGLIFKTSGEPHADTEVIMSPPEDIFPSLDSVIQQSSFGISSEDVIVQTDKDGYFEIETMTNIVARIQIPSINYDFIVSIPNRITNFASLSLVEDDFRIKEYHSVSDGAAGAPISLGVVDPLQFGLVGFIPPHDHDGRYYRKNELSSKLPGEGASLICIEDSSGNFISINVEGALAELFTGVAGADIETQENGSTISSAVDVLNFRSGIIASGGLTTDLDLDFTASGGDFGTAVTVSRGDHLHDLRYFTETELGSSSTPSGGSLIGYDNAASGLVATETQSAIDELDGRIDTIEAGTHFISFTGDTGTANADNLSDSLKIAGGIAIFTVASDDPEVVIINIDGTDNLIITGDWDFNGGTLRIPQGTTLPLVAGSDESDIFWISTTNTFYVFDGVAWQSTGVDTTSIDYAFVSGNDGATDVTGAELEELTDGSDTTLHIHDGRYFTESELGSTSAPSGASLIGIEDSGGNFIATDVEAALAELGSGMSNVDTEENGTGVDTDVAVLNFVDGIIATGGAGTTSLNLDFVAAGGDAGTAVTVARGDHIHDAIYFTETELGDTGSPGGASLIGIFDTAGNFTATDVEAALAELFNTISNGTIETQENGTTVDGTVATLNFVDGIIATDSGSNVTALNLDFTTSGGDNGTALTVARGDHIHDLRYFTETELGATTGAGLIGYDNTTSGLTAIDVQAAIDEIEGRVDTVEGFDYTDISGNDAATDITGAELEELSDGSDTALHIHDSRYFTETEIGSTSGTSGAELVGIEDTATNFTATDVEGALAELATGIGAEHIYQFGRDAPNVTAGSFFRTPDAVSTSASPTIIALPGTLVAASIGVSVAPTGSWGVEILINGSVVGTLTDATGLLLKITSSSLSSAVVAGDELSVRASVGNAVNISRPSVTVVFRR